MKVVLHLHTVDASTIQGAIYFLSQWSVGYEATQSLLNTYDVAVANNDPSVFQVCYTYPDTFESGIWGRVTDGVLILSNDPNLL